APYLEGPGFTPTRWAPLADGTARFVGEPVAAVVAESACLAADAREATVVDYAPRPAVVTLEAALADGDVIVRRAGGHGDSGVAPVASRLGRPVKWIEDRRDNLAAGSHAREQRVEAEIAADATGRVLALRARFVSDGGAYHSYPLTQALEPLGSAMILPGPYLTAASAGEAV